MGDGFPVHFIFAVRDSGSGAMASFRRLERMTASLPKAELLLAAPIRAKFLALPEVDGRVRCGATTRR